MRVYAFYGKGVCFQKFRSICSALAAVKGDESRVFVHVEGIPNPWFVHPIKNGKVNRKKVIKPSQLDACKKKFKTSVGLFG